MSYHTDPCGTIAGHTIVAATKITSDFPMPLASQMTTRIWPNTLPRVRGHQIVNPTALIDQVHAGGEWWHGLSWHTAGVEMPLAIPFIVCFAFSGHCEDVEPSR